MSMTKLETKIYRYIKSFPRTDEEVKDKFCREKFEDKLLVARALDDLHLSRKISYWYHNGQWVYSADTPRNMCICQHHSGPYAQNIKSDPEYQRAFELYRIRAVAELKAGGYI